MRCRDGRPALTMTWGTPWLVLALLLPACGPPGGARGPETPPAAGPAGAPGAASAGETSRGKEGGPSLVTEGYAQRGSCRQCHAAIAESYEQVAMARSFRRAPGAESIEDFGRGNRLEHTASGFVYEMRREGGRIVQRRFEPQADGRPARVFEREATFIIGSGRHARSYLHLAPSGEMTQLPVTWYTEEGRWGMSPGYDRRDQPDFFRPVTYACLFCHDAYPDVPAGRDLPYSVSLFPQDLPSGIDCQRCHGPGARHVDLARRSDAPADEVRRAIVNPARLTAERQMDLCMECHLETTSGGAWNAVLAFGRGVFSYRPGQELAAYRHEFDYAPVRGPSPDSLNGERFDIAHQAYRLRQAACFRRSAGRMTCLTCHDPHRKPEDPATYFASRCLGCHEREQCGGMHRGPEGAQAGENCIACHMPRRRTDDVVHVTMTDHLIRKRHPAREALLAPRREPAGLYKGPIAFYRDDEAPPGPERDLYLGVASVLNGVDRDHGVALLEKAIAARRPGTAEPYFRLGVALLEGGREGDAVERFRTAARLDPGNPSVLFGLGNALTAAGKAEEALASYDAALAPWPGYSEAHTNAGNLLFRDGRLEEALARFDRAIALRPDNAEAHSNRGAVLARLGRPQEARAAFQEALRIDPARAEAASNLAVVLLDLGEEDEAVRVLRGGLARNPSHPGMLSRLAFVLATSPRQERRDGREALRLAQSAVRLTSRKDPRALDALAAALAEVGRAGDGARVASEAVRLASAQGQAGLAAAIEKRRQAYARGGPYRAGS
ncbi:MAG: hypothetical protein DMF50_06695 [Acidobacteria bacterium]|nr:MAG: hypothetical protein DMF50_06695 [Acidobacteriota bacterium]